MRGSGVRAGGSLLSDVFELPMRTRESLRWKEYPRSAPPPSDDAAAGIWCAPCNMLLMPYDSKDTEAIITEHLPHGEAYLATEEPDGSVTRRGRIRRMH